MGVTVSGSVWCRDLLVCHGKNGGANTQNTYTTIKQQNDKNQADRHRVARLMRLAQVSAVRRGGCGGDPLEKLGLRWAATGRAGTRACGVRVSGPDIAPPTRESQSPAEALTCPGV